MVAFVRSEVDRRGELAGQHAPERVEVMEGRHRLLAGNCGANAPEILVVGRTTRRMDSVRQGLRSGDIEKDTYERLNCSSCDVQLATENEPGELGKVRVCPECGEQWQEMP